MSKTEANAAAQIYRLRRFLSLPAHGRAGLVGRLQKERTKLNGASRLYVSNVYDGGEAGRMCAIKLVEDLRAAALTLAPIEQIAIDRRHPLSRKIALHLRLSPKRH